MNSVSQFFSQVQDGLIYLGMPAVTCYHLLCSNVFLNTAAEDAQGLEKIGNIALSSYRYLFAGNSAHVNEDGTYDIRQHFDYHELLFAKTTGALITLPFSLSLGSALKGLAFLSDSVRERHHAIVSALHSPCILSKLDLYRSLLIDIGEKAVDEKLLSLGYERRPGDEYHLSEEKRAFSQIVQLLKDKKILFWADCGTCLGAYRYGGIIPWDNDLDLAILEPDFENMRHALNALDPSLYLVENWSSRMHPKTYVRVYIRSTRQYIDIYTYAIHPDNKSIQYICSNVDNMFMREGWKINERRYMVETSFDVVFPLRLADFDGIEVPVPHQTEKYLQMRYGENLAPVKTYNVESGLYERDLSHPYWQRAYAH
jgi:LicD family